MFAPAGFLFLVVVQVLDLAGSQTWFVLNLRVSLSGVHVSAAPAGLLDHRLVRMTATLTV